MRFVKDILITIFALGTCACVKVLDPEQGESPSSAGYHVRIQAALAPGTRSVTFNGDEADSHFSASDKIYVYNVTQQAWARFADEDHNLSYLQPTIISGRICTLEGDLLFYSWDDDNDDWKSVTVQVGDQYRLYYLMNKPNYYFTPSVAIPQFDYSQQDGSATSASQFDFAEATNVTMMLSGTTLSVPGGIQLNNLQSMFRQRLSFTNEGEAVTPMPTITKLTVGTKNDTLLEYDRPDHPIEPTYPGDTNIRFWTFSFDIDNPVITADGDIFLSLAFYYPDENSAAGDQLILTATDSEGNVYECAKDVPEGGFQKSKFYYGACEMEWQYKQDSPILPPEPGTIIKPIVTCGVGVVLSSDPDESNGLFYFDDSNPDPTCISISGNSTGCRFVFDNNAVITLAGEGTAIIPDNHPFIHNTGWALTIILDSDFTIDCRYSALSIFSEYDELKLQTSGDVPHTLTVIANDPDYRGLYDFYWYDGQSSCKPSDLAFEGYSVELTNTTDGPDGDDDDTDPDYYTWVYTVTPTP